MVVAWAVTPGLVVDVSLDLVDDGVGELSCIFVLDNCESITSQGGMLCGDTYSGPSERQWQFDYTGTAYLFIDTEEPRDFTLTLTVP